MIKFSKILKIDEKILRKIERGEKLMKKTKERIQESFALELEKAIEFPGTLKRDLV